MLFVHCAELIKYKCYRISEMKLVCNVLEDSSVVAVTEGITLLFHEKSKMFTIQSNLWSSPL